MVEGGVDAVADRVNVRQQRGHCCITITAASSPAGEGWQQSVHETKLPWKTSLLKHFFPGRVHCEKQYKRKAGRLEGQEVVVVVVVVMLELAGTTGVCSGSRILII